MGRDELKQSRANSARKEKKKKKMYLLKGKKTQKLWKLYLADEPFREMVWNGCQ